MALGEGGKIRCEAKKDLLNGKNTWFSPVLSKIGVMLYSYILVHI